MVYFTIQNNKFPKFIMIKKRIYAKIFLIRKRFIFLEVVYLANNI